MDNVWVAVIASGIAMIPGILALILGQRKEAAAADELESSAADKLTATAMELLNPLRERIKETDNELRALRQESMDKSSKIINLENQISHMRERELEKDAGIERLLYQLKSMGAVPVWTPNKDSA